LSLTIRDADPARDAAACLAIYAPYVEATPISFEEEAPGLETFAGRIRSAQQRHRFLVAEDAGAIAGYAYAGVHRTRAAYRWTTEVAVYVARERHRSGVGRRLYENLFDRLREQNYRLAVAGVTLPNDASVGLHEALGFRKVGVFPRIGWKFGRWHDVGWWSLDLHAPADEPPDELTAAQP
jgi:L-amino acid N-acyltransferase YncA